MHHKNILLIARTSRFYERMGELKHALDASILPATPQTFQQAISTGQDFDLVILDLDGLEQDTLNAVDSYVADNGFIPTLFIQDEDKLSNLHMPAQGRNDFVLSSAGKAEFAVRCALLLWPGEESASADIVTVDNMTINLATYQVRIAGEPVDLTYLEYALLSFLVQHPNRTFTRDTLLQNVWGFDYYGGSRTVDVHVRRIRAKLGPALAQHLETVRGVGYLWNSH